MLVVVSFIFLLVVLALWFLAASSGQGKAVGLQDGQLSQCADKPNCVCSEYRGDVSHYIDPINLSRTGQDDVQALVVEVLQEMGGDIQAESNHYVAATFSSRLFGFVDDLEVRLDSAAHRLQVRSASRVGYSDGGVNRKRVQRFRTKLENRLRQQTED